MGEPGHSHQFQTTAYPHQDATWTLVPCGFETPAALLPVSVLRVLIKELIHPPATEFWLLQKPMFLSVCNWHEVLQDNHTSVPRFYRKNECLYHRKYLLLLRL